MSTKSYVMEMRYKSTEALIADTWFDMSDDSSVRRLIDKFYSHRPDWADNIPFMVGATMGAWSAGKRDMENPMIQKRCLTMRSTMVDLMIVMRYPDGDGSVR